MRFKNTFKPQGPQSQDGHTEDGAKPACLYLHSEIPPWIDDAHRFIRSGLSCGCRHASAWRIHGELGINISRSTSLKPSQHQRVLQVSEWLPVRSSVRVYFQLFFKHVFACCALHWFYVMFDVYSISLVYCTPSSGSLPRNDWPLLLIAMEKPESVPPAGWCFWSILTSLVWLEAG